jgi:DNA-binding response OmpR family regulator
MSKILIAEDDKFLANAYRVKLKKAGFEVKIVTDGEEAMQALQVEIPDLLLLDLVMPKKDGFSVLEDMSKTEQYKKIPVIVASNLGQKEDIEKAKNLGAKDYIVKSDLGISEVVDKINANLN